MKQFLFVVVFGFMFNSVCAQGIYNIKTGSAYQSPNIESQNTYNIRKSHNYKEKAASPLLLIKSTLT